MIYNYRYLTMHDFSTLPAAHGAYVLHLFLARSQTVTISRLGPHRLSAGHYFYCGSARGAGGLRSRVGRHLHGDGRPHWHIDYLRVVVEVRAVVYTVTNTPLECVWSQAVAHLPSAFIPILHFGASDCRSGCRAHLVAFPRRVDIASVPRVLAQTTPAPIASLRFR